MSDYTEETRIDWDSPGSKQNKAHSFLIGQREQRSEGKQVSISFGDTILLEHAHVYILHIIISEYCRIN